ncbi:hypothetical protein [Paraliomyxa miuraensis]|uniref:hypothetical protein n=1 Tax=Paraliomyxa miuraensis TaxID=376150 RepID=UPI00225BF8CD|nr:hypothetical protein [Paraliomyxa miuraensis]MCX4245210.1 hypothetical protein [Paraliomyxa miuraensis]
MPKRRSFLTQAALPLLLLPWACAGQADDPASPEVRSGDAPDAPLQAMRIEFTVPAAHANATDIAALVEHIEGLADVAQAKAMVHKADPEGDAEVAIDLYGHDLPTDDELSADLTAEFPYLAGVPLAVSGLDPEAAPTPAEDHEEDPEALRQRIIDDLRAKGVEGEIDVVITDHPDGRREVEVQVHDDEPPPA